MAGAETLRDVQSFLSFPNFYQRFIKDILRIPRSLTESTTGAKKDWPWMPKMQKFFEELKNRFITAPIFTHFDQAKTCIIEIEELDCVLRAILAQKDDNARLNLIVFYSRKFQSAEINYEVSARGHLALINPPKMWCHNLEAVLCTMMLYSDHQDLQYFKTTKMLNLRQPHWAQELAAYEFKIVYSSSS
jgi:hypothetical protein